MRILLHTGKGGVGKTTVAAATAVELAQRGRRVLVMSTDPAHSLGDSLGVPLGNDPTPIEVDGGGSLAALEIDAMAENDKAWGTLRDYLAALAAHQGGPSLLNDEMLLFPGLGELFSLLRILDHADDYDVLVVDCAPTGETLSLLHYPERLSRLIELALPTKRAMLKVVRKPLEKLTSIPVPADRLFDDVLELTERLRRLGTLLRDDAVTTVRLVTMPERIVVAETRRNLTWLTMYGFTVDGVVLNRVYPAEALEGYFAPWVEQQAASVALVEQSFAHVPVLRLALQSHEVVGLSALTEVAGRLYGDVDPAEVFYRGEFYRVVRREDGVELQLVLPDADKASLDLRQDGGDLVLNYRGSQRRIELPDSLRGKDVQRARYADDRLLLTMV